MAYDNNNRGGFPGRQYPNQNARQLPPEVKALPLPEDYVDEAEAVIRRLAEREQNDSKAKIITTSKIRNLLSLISDVYNVENLRNEAELAPESVTALTMARIRVVYEAGRESSVKYFVKEAKLLQYLKDIKRDRKKLIDFSHYMEALVAYHRLYIGGKEG